MTSTGLVSNPFDVPLYNVTVQVEWFVYDSPETVVQTTTATLVLPELLPGETSGFVSTISTDPHYSWEMSARASVVSSDTASRDSYEALTIVSAEIEIGFPGSYDCGAVLGTLRNDHPFALRDVRLEAIGRVQGLTGSHWSPEWFDSLPGGLQQGDGTRLTTIGPGETLSYVAQNGCGVPWFPPEVEVQVVAKGIPVR
jgi:hypothetical protein